MKRKQKKERQTIEFSIRAVHRRVLNCFVSHIKKRNTFAVTGNMRMMQSFFLARRNQKFQLETASGVAKP